MISLVFLPKGIQNLQTLFIALLLLVVVLFMPHCQPFLQELFPPLGINADAHRVARRCGVVTKDLSHLVKQADS